MKQESTSASRADEEAKLYAEMRSDKERFDNEQAKKSGPIVAFFIGSGVCLVLEMAFDHHRFAHLFTIGVLAILWAIVYFDRLYARREKAREWTARIQDHDFWRRLASGEVEADFQKRQKTPNKSPDGGRSDGVGTLIVKKAGAHRVEDRRRSEGGPIASDKGAFWPGWTT